MAVAESASFGALLRKHRVRAGLTQQALAERAGLSLRGVSDLERGARRAPYPDTVRRLAEAIGLNEAEHTALVASSSRAALEANASPALQSVTTVLPMPLGSFVGREQELYEIQPLLLTTRLVTLVGVGGVGKTRLALELARRTTLNGLNVAMVELAPVVDPSLVASAIAAVVGAREQPHRPLLETLIDAFRSRRFLLILDNCEHLVRACAELADHLLRACPKLSILATSREPLGVDGEVVRRVQPLSLPQPGVGSLLTEVERCDAGRLFVERARATGIDFALDERNAPAVAEICHRLDGIPLALVLAASRVGVLTVEQIAQRLDDRFRLLTSGVRTASARQQTLRATVEWSYDLLDERERLVFERLAAFAGGAHLEAAEDVCSGLQIEPDDVLDLLARLIAKSLVSAGTSPDGTRRYQLLETLRQFAAERLRDRGDSKQTHQRHAACFLHLAEQAAPQAFDADPALDRLEREHDNLRAALRWLIERPDADRAQRLGVALGRLWFYRGYATEGRKWLDELLVMPGGSAPTHARTELCYRAGMLGWVQGDTVAAEVVLEEGMELARQIGDSAVQSQLLFALGHVARTRGAPVEADTHYEAAAALARSGGHRRHEAIALQGLAWVAYDQGNYANARRWLEEVVRIATELGATSVLLQSLSILGDVCRQQGDHTAARSLAEQALIAARELGARWWVASCSAALAQVTLEQGEYELTNSLDQESLTLACELGDQQGIAKAIEVNAQLAAMRGQAERALCLGAVALGIREAIGVPLAQADRDRLYMRLAAVRRTLVNQVAKRAWARGQSMSIEQAVAVAMETPRTRTLESDARSIGTPSLADALTRREREVARQLARGLTNRQISEVLVITVATVERHVSNILGKLGLATRSQVALWAVKHGLEADRTVQSSDSV
jgi:predicted ATPase/DNA-binding NarL/FixJ family response regulator/DNA-binding XRE family transcriptional regulator